jgi:hypothetical protein
VRTGSPVRVVADVFSFGGVRSKRRLVPDTGWLTAGR